MILLLNAWVHGAGDNEEPEWATISLSIDTIDNYLSRINQAQELRVVSGAAFFKVLYWDGLPVWVGSNEVWEDLYQDEVQIVEHLQEQGQSIGTDCTLLSVTPGVCWETSLTDTTNTARTAEITIKMLGQLRALLVQKEDSAKVNLEKS